MYNGPLLGTLLTIVWLMPCTDPAYANVNDRAPIFDAIIVRAIEEAPEMPTAFSPNGDGMNDLFVILGLEAYPKNLITVVNRWGNVVYERANYTNTWAGENMQGQPLPDGTYFVRFEMNSGEKAIQGFVEIRR